MEHIRTVENCDSDSCSELLEVDIPANCPRCSGKHEAAHRNISQICQWWLGPKQRKEWDVKTRVRVHQGIDKERSDFLFDITLSSATSVPIFQIIVQHSLPKATKGPLHYQLQIPNWSELTPAGRRANLEPAVKRLGEKARRALDKLRDKALVSISLHELLDEQALNTVKTVVSDLVVDLCRLDWTWV
jgi:hypothetical protein